MSIVFLQTEANTVGEWSEGCSVGHHLKKNCLIRSYFFTYYIDIQVDISKERNKHTIEIVIMDIALQGGTISALLFKNGLWKNLFIFKENNYEFLSTRLTCAFIDMFKKPGETTGTKKLGKWKELIVFTVNRGADFSGIAIWRSDVIWIGPLEVSSCSLDTGAGDEEWSLINLKHLWTVKRVEVGRSLRSAEMRKRESLTNWAAHGWLNWKSVVYL